MYRLPKRRNGPRSRKGGLSRLGKDRFYSKTRTTVPRKKRRGPFSGTSGRENYFTVNGRGEQTWTVQDGKRKKKKKPDPQPHHYGGCSPC